MDRSEKDGGDESEVKVSKGKSCKGYLYFSSTLKSKAHNPRCIGISRTLQQVPGYIVGQTEMEASKEDRGLSDFSYGCVGYSVYLDRIGKEPVTDNKQGAKPELPVCVGLEILVDRRVSTDEPASAPAPAPAPTHIHNREGNMVHDEFPCLIVNSGLWIMPYRFTRNANLVALGVARNMRRVGNSIKETFEDIVYPYRKPPK
uniref:DUF8204 domain-containing protein n=1 Tax=Fagus sylvatica TaxID=28930 RepID=A0A2N9IRX8_FAGSY